MKDLPCLHLHHPLPSNLQHKSFREQIFLLFQGYGNMNYIHPNSPAFATVISGQRAVKAKLQVKGGCCIDIPGRLCASDISGKKNVAVLQITDIFKRRCFAIWIQGYELLFFFPFPFKATKNMFCFMYHRGKILCLANCVIIILPILL